MSARTKQQRVRPSTRDVPGLARDEGWLSLCEYRFARKGIPSAIQEYHFMLSYTGRIEKFSEYLSA